jgi:2,3-dihydroxybenzoate decarboxylase
LNRRNLLKGAALAAVVKASGALASASPEPIDTAEPLPVKPLGKIALEEHFMVQEFLPYFAETFQNISPEIAKLAPIALEDYDRRIAIMDQHQVDFVVLSLAGPGVQVEKDVAVAIKRSKSVNDFLAAEIQKRPARFGGFAHLAMQNPREAADELERCIRDLGFQGAMINGQTNGEYLDLDKYSVFWERVADLGVPVYLHPANPVDHPAMYDGHQELWGPVCSWAFETATHALRLVFTGVFERYPKARIVLGHMGETLPLNLWRFDSRWLVSHRGSMTLPQAPSFYIKRNIAVTTSGVCSDISLRCALEAMGNENVMFSMDYPFEKTELAAQFIQDARISDADRIAVASGNAKRILRINRPIGQVA